MTTYYILIRDTSPYTEEVIYLGLFESEELALKAKKEYIRVVNGYNDLFHCEQSYQTVNLEKDVIVSKFNVLNQKIEYNDNDNQKEKSVNNDVTNEKNSFSFERKQLLDEQEFPSLPTNTNTQKPKINISTNSASAPLSNISSSSNPNPNLIFNGEEKNNKNLKKEEKQENKSSSNSTQFQSNSKSTKFYAISYTYDSMGQVSYGWDVLCDNLVDLRTELHKQSKEYKIKRNNHDYCPGIAVDIVDLNVLRFCNQEISIYISSKTPELLDKDIDKNIINFIPRKHIFSLCKKMESETLRVAKNLQEALLQYIEYGRSSSIKDYMESVNSSWFYSYWPGEENIRKAHSFLGIKDDYYPANTLSNSSHDSIISSTEWWRRFVQPLVEQYTETKSPEIVTLSTKSDANEIDNNETIEGNEINSKDNTLEIKLKERGKIYSKDHKEIYKALAFLNMELQSFYITLNSELKNEKL